MQRLLITVGVALILAGLLWPWLARIGLGRLPGDLIFRRDGVTVYIPIVTSIIVSVVVTILIWLFRR